MNLLTLAAVAALTLTDPTSDALGDGTLTPPTSPVYAHSAIFDLQEVVLTVLPEAVDTGAAADEPATASAVVPPSSPRATLAVTMGAVDLDPGSAAGFTGVVIDVYLDSAPGGSETTLAGPGMLLPSGGGWEYAVRLSPAGAHGIEYRPPTSGAPGEVITALDPAAEEVAQSGAEAPAATGEGVVDDGGLSLRPLQLTIDGNRLVVDLPWPLDEDVVVYAVTGVYDPFSRDSWRALASSPTPWAFSGTDQLVPVVDVLALDQDTQVQALRTGVLPAPQRTASSGLPWLLLMGAGVVLAVTGLVMRRRVKAERSGWPYGLPPEEPEESEQPRRPVAAAEPGEELAAEPAEEMASEPAENVGAPEPAGSTTREPVAASDLADLDDGFDDVDRPFGLPPLEDDFAETTPEPTAAERKTDLKTDPDTTTTTEAVSTTEQDGPAADDKDADPFARFDAPDDDADEEDLEIEGFEKRDP